MPLGSLDSKVEFRSERWTNKKGLNKQRNGQKGGWTKQGQKVGWKNKGQMDRKTDRSRKDWADVASEAVNVMQETIM